MSYPNSPLSPYSGALVLQFSPSPFYTFLALSLMVPYQLKSLHLDDYNLIYIQNKNKGFDKFLTAFPLKTQHFPFTNIPQNQYQSTMHFKNQPNTTPKLIYNQSKSPYIRLGFFPKSKHKKKRLGFSFSYL